MQPQNDADGKDSSACSLRMTQRERILHYVQDDGVGQDDDVHPLSAESRCPSFWRSKARCWSWRRIHWGSQRWEAPQSRHGATLGSE